MPRKPCFPQLGRVFATGSVMMGCLYLAGGRDGAAVHVPPLSREDLTVDLQVKILSVTGEAARVSFVPVIYSR